MPTLITLNNLNLSALEIKALVDWPDPIIEDYLSILEALNDAANVLNSDLGTMALQNANDVLITGGSLANVSIDATAIITGTLTATTATIGTINVTTLNVDILVLDTLTATTITATDGIFGSLQSTSLVATTLVADNGTFTVLNASIFNAVDLHIDNLYVSDSIILEQTTDNYTVTWNDPAAARALTVIDPGGDDYMINSAIVAARVSLRI